MRKLLGGIIVSTMAITSINAHEVWLELDKKKDEAKLYFGHFAGKQTEGGKKFKRINEGITYPKDLVKDVKRNDNNIRYTLNKQSDMVVVRSSEPRQARDSELMVKRVSYSKAGRTQTNAITDFDIVPTKKNSNTFKVIYKDKAAQKTKITVISPTEWEKTFRPNKEGEFTIHTPWIGEYLIKASFEDETKGEIDNKAYDKTLHSMSYTIVQDNGIAWNSSKK